MTIDSSSSTLASVPLNRKPRTLVLCFDGTSNEYGTAVGPYFLSTFGGLTIVSP
jgi:uncharacterized protein (DUF2235 family)